MTPSHQDSDSRRHAGTPQGGSPWDRVHNVGQETDTGSQRIMAMAAGGILGGLIFGTVLASLPLIVGVTAVSQADRHHRSQQSRVERTDTYVRWVSVGTSWQRFCFGFFGGGALSLGAMLVYDFEARRRRR